MIEEGEPVAVLKVASRRERDGFEVLEAVQGELDEGIERL